MRKLLALLLIPAASFAFDFTDVTPEMASQEWGVGYIPTACPFDLDDDGVWGEPEDCTICDDVEGTTQVLEDFDNDGEFEVQTYVDAGGMGFDALDCGGPQQPCKTVNYALYERHRVAEGENVVCFRGKAHETIRDGGQINGQEGSKIWRHGRMSEDWTVPKNPTMIVGWDYDQDDVYPHEDPDDVAEFIGEKVLEDGTTSYLGVFFWQDCQWTGTDCKQVGMYDSTQRWEMAGFKASRYGTDPENLNSSRGLFFSGRTMNEAPPSDNVFWHDIKAREINFGGDSRSNSHMLYGGWSRHAIFNHTVWNIDLRDSCGYIWRGSGAGSGENAEKDGLLIKNVTITYSCGANPVDGNAGVPGLKPWGQYSRIRFMENYIDQSPVPWAIKGTTKVSGGMMSINTCIEDFVAEYNIIKNSWNPFVVQGGSNRGCRGRNGKKIAFRYNVAINDDGWITGIPIVMSPGANEYVYTEDIDIRGNYFVHFGAVDETYNAPGWSRMIHIQNEPPMYDPDGNLLWLDNPPSDHLINIESNTFLSPEVNGWSGAFTVGAGDHNDELRTQLSHQWRLAGNVFAVASTNKSYPNYASTWHSALGNPLDIIMEWDNNVWEHVDIDDGGGNKLWRSHNGDLNIKTDSLAEFAAVAWGATDRGYGQNHCLVEFENRAVGDVRIAATDTCANGAGADISWLASFTPPDPCGNGICEPELGETWETCPDDCEQPQPPAGLLRICIETSVPGSMDCYEGNRVHVEPKEE